LHFDQKCVKSVGYNSIIDKKLRQILGWQNLPKNQVNIEFEKMNNQYFLLSIFNMFFFFQKKKKKPLP